MEAFRNILMMMIVLIAVTESKAQNEWFTISGVVLIDKEMAEGATVVVQNARDSSFVKGVMVNADGVYSIPNLHKGQYIISFSMLGYHNEDRMVDLISDFQIDTIQLSLETSQLAEVSVVGKKQQMEILPDRVVFNPSLMNSQTNVLDMLKSLPGVVIKEDGTIMLNGQSNVTVMVDGRKLQLSGESLKNLLVSMQSSNVSNVELIERPSVEMEANGTSGVIQINRHRGSYVGQSGSVYTNFQQGKYAQNTSGINYMYQNERISFSVDYTRYERQRYHELTIRKIYLEKTEGDTLVTGKQVPYSIYHEKNNYANFEFTYNLSENSYIGLYGRYGNEYCDEKGSIISEFFRGVHRDSVYYHQFDGNYIHTENYNSGFYFISRKSNKRELRCYVDYIHYDMNSDTKQDAAFFNDNTGATSKWKLSSDPDKKIKIYSAQIDYSKPLNQQLALKCGARTNYSDLSQGVLYWRDNNGEKKMDYDLSNHIEYNEWISGGYLEVQYKKDKWAMHAGLRVESTQIDGCQGDMRLLQDSIFDSSFFNFFPGLSIQYQKNEDHIFSFQYNKKIRRPGFRELSPYVEMFDEYTYQKGNSYLKPEIQHNLDLTYTLKKAICVSLFYIQCNDVITKNFVSAPKNRAYILPENLPKAFQYGVNAGISSISPVKWWDYNLTVSYRHSEYLYYINRHTTYSDHDEKISKERVSDWVYVHMNNRFSLPWKISVELSGYAYTGSYQGQAWAYPQWDVWTSMGRSFCDGKVYASLFCTSLFNSNHDRIRLEHSDMIATAYNRNDDRRIGISLSWRFSKGKEVKKVDHGSGNSESNRLTL